MALTNAQILEEYMLARDAIVQAIVTGRDVVEYQVMSQRKRTADPVAELKVVESMIAYYERKVDNATLGRSRNYAQLARAYSRTNDDAEAQP